jgi:molybdenum cofactor biosynthesis enzyme MoaA
MEGWGPSAVAGALAMIPGYEANKEIIERELAQKSSQVAGLPYYYQVHLNKFCNQKCIMCMPDGKHPHDEMPLKNFIEFFEHIRASARHLTLIGGEPLMYRWIEEVLDLLSRAPIAVTVITNATALTEGVSRRLLALHELELRCSIDAASRAMYLKIHGTDHFNRVASQISRFSRMAQAQSNTHLIMHYVVMRENLAEVLPFVDFAKQYKPHRVEFHPVRHVSDWTVSNDTGWTFKGPEQSCETFKELYNETMSQVKAKCEADQVPYEVVLL